MTLSSQPPTNAIQVIRNTAITSGAYCLKIGDGHLWLDVTGDLRVCFALPSGDLSGAIIGTQS